MANVELRNVRKTYGSVEVIKGVDVSIHDGEFVALVGPSGCGKSTLLRMIAGLEDFSGGEVVIGDRVVNDVQPKERDIAMVFQSYALYPNLTVGANLGFALKLRKAPKAEREAKVARAASILGLTELLDRYPRQLSGGQRQRVAMGRAIVRDPKVFLFDEPLSNLDAKLRVQMRAEIRSLHRKLATTTIYVTHDQVEAMTMADRIVVLRAGKVEQVGRPLDLYDNPANLFVATFIGSPAMNLLDGSMTESGTFRLEGSAHELTVPPLAAPPAVGTRVVLGIRPEHLDIAETGLPVTLTAIEPTGHETFLGAEVDGQQIGILAGERVSVSIDERIAVRLRPDRTMVFGVEDGLRFAPVGGQAGTGL